MAERKRFGGDRDTAVDYLGVGRNLLDQLLASMHLNGLQVLRRQVELPSGVIITVSSVFGQHDIRIDAPPALAEQVQADIDALADNPQPLTFGKLTDVVKVSGSIRLTLTTPNFSENFNPDPSSSDTTTNGNGINVNLFDHVLMTSSITITLVTETYPAYTPPPAPPQIFIGGQTSRGLTPFIWDDVNGYAPLNIGNTIQRRNAKVYGFSADGAVIVGSVDVSDPAAPGNYPTHPAKWQTKTDQAQVQTGINGNGSGTVAYEAFNNGTTVYCSGIAYPGTNPQAPWCIKWDGTNGGNAYVAGHALVAAGLTSSNRRLKVSGLNYQIDGGAWVNWGPNSTVLPSGARQAPGDAVALCCLHVPYTPPAPPQPTFTTTVLVFSG